ncbi:MAG: hypothetical protein ABIJ31_05995 [Pseudomonadota bacterium]
MTNRPVIIIDETLREGMQYRGLMFSKKQRLAILDFQEQIRVDICQAGYPPAHEQEADMVKALVEHAKKNKYNIRMAAMGRAGLHDAVILLDTGVNDFHLHLQIAPDLPEDELNRTLNNLLTVHQFIQDKAPHAKLCLIMLDMGRSDEKTLKHCDRFCSHHKIDMLSLPDTSGIMAPNQVFDTITRLFLNPGNSKISIHCHNDMGMATANSIMGIIAGGNVLEASVLGIGERNGIADLYTAARVLKDQGFLINLNTRDEATFKAYYQYIDSIVYEQLGDHLLNVNTPFFGDAVKTHVAGTHATGEYGMATEERYYLNSLCGRNMVIKFLNLHQIHCPENQLGRLTREIKTQSIELNRSLMPDDIKKIIVLLANSG